MKQIILPVTIHLNTPTPCPLAGRNRQGAPTGPGRPAYLAGTMPRVQGCGKCSGEVVGSASMKKASLNPSHHGLPPVPQARRLVHESFNYDGSHCIALDDGEECVCVSPFPLLPVVPVVPGGECFAAGQRNWKQPCSTAWTPNGAPSAGALFTPLQPGQILPECAGRMKSVSRPPSEAEQERAKCHALGAENPL